MSRPTQTRNTRKPSPLLERWARVVHRRRRLVLAVAVLAVLSAGVWGTGIFAKVQTAGGFDAPHSQSQQADTQATQAFGRDAGDVVVLYSSPTLTTASPAFRDAVTGALAALPASRVASTTTYWSTGSRAFISANGHQTYAVLELTGATDTARQDRYDAVKGDLGAPGLTTQVGGVVPANETIDDQATTDVTRAESLSFPVLLILLTVIFGGLVAASLPVMTGAVAILGSFTALRLLTLLTPVSIFSVNITTILGLGLAIDYGLFVVSRFREELPRHATVEDAVAATLATAGRTVIVSGVTVALVLASLMLFPETILRSMGYGGVATVVVDMLAALTVLPALLSVLGPRVNALRVRRSATVAPVADATGGWYRLARQVMRRPVAVALPIVVLLLALGSPFLHAVWGGIDATVLPSAAAPRMVTESLNRDFPGNPTAPIEAIATFITPLRGAPTERAALASYVRRLKTVPGVTGARVTGISGDVARVDLSYTASPFSAQARTIVGHARGVAPPAGARVAVGGQTAELVDELASLGRTLPWMALVVVVATFALQFLAFGSLVLPLQAIVMSALSLTAMYGVVTWIFQDGHLSRLLGFTPNGTLSPTTPILMFAIMFGLSMDYEVFLLSRVRERYDATGDTTAAVAGGLQRTGGVITSAALLLLVVVGAFSASGVTFIKLLGVGMIVALLIDATLVRVLLVPATMRLLGTANWWAPAPLRRLYSRYGMKEAGDGPAPTAALPTPEPAPV